MVSVKRKVFIPVAFLFGLVAVPGVKAELPDPFALGNQAKRAAPREVKPAAPKSGAAVAKNLHLQAELQPAKAKPGEVVRLTIKGTLEPGYHTYPVWKRTDKQPAGELTKFSLESPDF